MCVCVCVFVCVYIHVYVCMFGQDLLVASIFRNFILAERVLRSVNCTPVSVPAMPSSFQHPLWSAWDLAVDVCLSQLPAVLKNPDSYVHSTFFTEQLTGFEVWLELGGHEDNKMKPLELPIVLQVLLSQAHRVRALCLLARFLDMGSWAVNHALSVGIFPYVLKLLQSPARDLREALVFIWAKILTVDSSCTVDLIRDAGHRYFLNFLTTDNVPLNQKALSLGVVSIMVSEHADAKERCIEAGLIECLLQALKCLCPHVRRWSCLCAGQLWEGSEKTKERALYHQLPQAVGDLLGDTIPQVRAAALYSLGTYMRVERDAAPPAADYSTPGDNSNGAAAPPPNAGRPGATGPGNPSASTASSGAPPPPAGEGPTADGECFRQRGIRGGAAGLRGTAEDGKARVDRELSLALAALGTLGDASPLVRRELVLLLGMLIRRFEESVVQVAVRAGWGRPSASPSSRDGSAGGGGAGEGGALRAAVPTFFDEADRDWLPLYQAARGEDVGVTVTGGGRGNSSSTSQYSSPSNSSNMPIPTSRRSPSKLSRLMPLDSDRDGAYDSPFPTEVASCILSTLLRLGRDPVSDIATHAGTRIV
jgi:hypothetical protein